MKLINFFTREKKGITKDLKELQVLINESKLFITELIKAEGGEDIEFLRSEIDSACLQNFIPNKLFPIYLYIDAKSMGPHAIGVTGYFNVKANMEKIEILDWDTRPRDEW